ncbi:MAG: polysaccharide biosynthesis protein [Candidatus Beckwithbacteria bacterium]|nr:polysaccharide biosynthesis protein [Patescibacteria group bacterium]
MYHKKIDKKNILVTGGVGSIGSVLVETLINNYSPNQVRIFDNNETQLFEAVRKYEKSSRARFMLGSVRDKDRVNWALKGVDTVFHCAALKHVALNEYSPFESVKTNVIGTQNLIEAALSNNIETFVNISTDKAANPTSTMGASKLLAERLTVGADYFKGKGKTVFASVRFGNVLNSSGSVLPIFLDQIEKGQSITLTDRRMVRYFMTIEEAVSLILKASEIALGGEVFILKMPALRISDLADCLMRLKGIKVTIKEIGKRPGEKLFEKIVTRTEAEQALELKEMYVLPPSIDYPGLSEDVINKSYQYYKKMGGKQVPSDGVKPDKLMKKDEIIKLLEKIV